MAAYVTSERSQRRAPLALIGLGCIALLSMAACSKLGLGGGDNDQMSWARAALERNGRLEVVAADPQTSTFTVRVKDTGELKMIRADQVVAEPTGAAAVPDGSATSGAAPGGTASPATTQPQAPSDSTLPPTTTASNSQAAPGSQAYNSAPLAASRGGPGSAAPESNTPDGAPPPSSAMSRSMHSSATDTAGTDVPRTGFHADRAPAAEAPNPNSDVASVTPGGRTLESGPGYAIKVASKSASAPTRAERTTSTAALERRHEPIICQGNRLLQIDNRNLEFDGDAVSAEDGCEIHITNSHIIAKGVGVSARRANVHIDNSQIEGDSASIDASEGAQVYATASRFKGLSRRLDNSSFHDLGGNVWN